jgi:Ohr subfamily peroxiredoxin
MQTLYTAIAHATGDGRNGEVYTDDGSLRTDVRIPTELGGPGGATNPEQLFAAGYAACFHSALKLVGRQEHLDMDGTEVSASVGLGQLDDGGFGLTHIELDVYAPNVERDAAEAIVAKAHTYRTNATRQRGGHAHCRVALRAPASGRAQVAALIRRVTTAPRANNEHGDCCARRQAGVRVLPTISSAAARDTGTSAPRPSRRRDEDPRRARRMPAS